MRRVSLLLALLAGCPASTPPQKGGDAGTLCRDHDDCAAHEYCLHNRCVGQPTAGDPSPAPAHLSATPGELSFGAVTPGSSRRLSVVLENEGARVVVIDRVFVEPAGQPFAIESMGDGPFWVRPGRARAIFVRYEPAVSAAHSAELVIESPAPNLRLPLVGQ